MELIWHPSCCQLWAQKSDKLLKVHLAIACEKEEELLFIVASLTAYYSLVLLGK